MANVLSWMRGYLSSVYPAELEDFFRRVEVKNSPELEGLVEILEEIKGIYEGQVSEEIMFPPKLAIREQLEPIMAGLVEQDHSALNMCVTHDFNIYLILELCLGRPIKDVGRIEHLEGLVFFEQDGVVQVTDHLGPPKAVRL